MPSAGIYIHIPFCQRKCGYCDFYSITRLQDQDHFQEALLREIALSAPAISAFTFDTIYFGGGTPSIMPLAFLETIWNRLHETYTIAPGGEYTIEVNPGTVHRNQLHHLRQLGFNRLSLGAQSFYEADLKFLGRIHTVQQIYDTVEDAKNAGFENINIDLMTAFPGLTPGRFRESLQQAITLNCEHISCYTLIYEPNTPFYRRLQKGTLTELSSDQQAEYYELANYFLAENGYTAYEISNFAESEKYYCQHNLKYWHHEPYIGLGPSAHSFISPQRWRNVRTLPAYIKRLQNSKSPVGGNETLTPEELEFEFIFLNLRMKSGLNFREYHRRFHSDFTKKYRQVLTKLTNAGFIENRENGVRLSAQGWLLADEVARFF